MALAQVVGTPDLLANILARLFPAEKRQEDEPSLDDLHNVYRTSRALRDGLTALLARAEQEGGVDEWLSSAMLSFSSPPGAYAMLAAMAPCVTQLSSYSREATQGNEHDTLRNKFLNAKMSSFRQLRHLKMVHWGRFDTLDRPWILSALPALRNLVDIELELLHGAGRTWECFHHVMAEGSLLVTRLRVRFRVFSPDEHRFNWPRCKLHTLYISFIERPNGGGRHVVTGLDQIATLRELTIKGRALTVHGLAPALDVFHLKGVKDGRFLRSYEVPRLSEDTSALIKRSPPQYTCLVSIVCHVSEDDNFAPLLLLPLTKLVGFDTDETQGPCACVCCHLPVRLMFGVPAA